MPGHNVTKVLAAVSAGDGDARSRLASLVYDDLHQIAARYMQRENRGQSLQPTILVHEAFLQLVDQQDRNWQNRAHFFAVAAQLMRRILIDRARSRNAVKRGGGHAMIQLDEAMIACDESWDELIDIDNALKRLAEQDERLGRVVELRFYAGMTEEEIGEVIGISVRQVKRDWKVAKAWLRAELELIQPGSEIACNKPKQRQ
jgi:RNA polymerase sigma-70 factor, ECF subfamily